MNTKNNIKESPPENSSPRHSTERPRHEYPSIACPVCEECGELVNPDGDGHEMTCSKFLGDKPNPATAQY